MNWGSIYITISLFGVVSSALLILFGWGYRKRKLIALFMGCSFMSGVMSLGAAGRSMSLYNLDTALIFNNLIYSGGALLPTLFFLFLFEYYGRGHMLPRTKIPFLFVIPVLSLIMIWTNNYHHLFIEEIIFSPEEGIMAAQTWVNGIYYHIHSTYGYLMVMFSLVIVMWHQIKAPRLYRKQTIVLLIYILLPLICSLLYTYQLIPLKSTLTPFAFFISNLVIAYDLFTSQHLGLLPIARRKVLGIIPDGMIIISKQGVILDANAAAASIIGFPENHLIGLHLRNSSYNGRKLYLTVSKMKSDGEHHEVCLSIEGANSHFNLTLTPLTSTTHRLEGFIIVLRDVSEYKQVQAQLEHSNHQLSASNTELDAYAHTVAHDLKSPLNTIRGLLHLIELEYEPTGEMKEIVKGLHKYSNKAISIIQELLLLSQVREAGNIELQEISSVELVTNSLERLESEIQRYRCAFRYNNPLHKALGYGPWVEEIWVNYLSNAIKYGGDNPLIEIGSEMQTNGQVRFWVKDHGPGLSDEHKANLWKHFGKLNTAREGHGLGLSIVKRIAERLGGTVGVESERGEGALFYFTLPEATKKMSRISTAHSMT